MTQRKGEIILKPWFNTIAYLTSKHNFYISRQYLNLFAKYVSTMFKKITKKNPGIFKI